MTIRKLFAVATLLLTAGVGSAFGQAFQGFNYQGIARDNGGAPIANQSIMLRVSLTEGSTGTAQYIETHQTTTNQFGLFTVVIGRGTAVSGTFAGVNWSSGSIFMRTELDMGSGYEDLGRAALLSVPYAIVAGSLATPAPPIAMNDLSDVNSGNAKNGQTLKWNGTAWVAGDDIAGFELPFSGEGQTVAETALFDITQKSEGPAVRISSTSPASTTSSVVVHKAGPGNGLDVTAGGMLGSAGSFTNDNIDNGEAALKSITKGVGNAGYFEINNRNSDSAAILGLTNGTGAGIFGQSTGNGRSYGIYGVADGECVSDNTGLRTFCPAGVFGTARRGPGVYGYNSGLGAGVLAYSENGRLFEGQGPTENVGFPDMRFYVDNMGKLYAERGIYTPGVHSSAMNATAELVTPGDSGVTPGDVMVVSEAGGFVQSTDTNQATVIGVVVDNAAFLGGNALDDDGNPVPSFAQNVQLAVSGLVTVNVTIENGAIAPGDMLVTSSTAGYAMKAGADPAPGVIVAKALEAFTGPDPGSVKAIVMLR